MSSIGNGATKNARSTRSARTRQLERDNRVKGLETGWTVFGYLLAGMASYGLIGWLIGRAVHVPVLFPLGMVVGLGISVGYVIYRFGKLAAADEQALATGRTSPITTGRTSPKAGAGAGTGTNGRTSVDAQGSVERNDR